MRKLARALAPALAARSAGILPALLLLAWLAGTAYAAAADLADGRLALPAGLRLGMTPEAVAAALATRPDATPATTTIRRPGAEEGQSYVQRVFHDLPGGRTLEVAFSDPAAGNRAVEITLADPQAEEAAAVRAEAERLYGPPAAVLPIADGRGFIAAWNGTAETEGAIRPQPGADSTLRLEFAPGPGSNLRLTGITGPDPAEAPAAAEHPAATPGR